MLGGLVIQRVLPVLVRCAGMASAVIVLGEEVQLRGAFAAVEMG